MVGLQNRRVVAFVPVALRVGCCCRDAGAPETLAAKRVWVTIGLCGQFAPDRRQGFAADHQGGAAFAFPYGAEIGV